MYSTYYTTSPSYSDVASVSTGSVIWMGIAAIIALVGGILIYFLFVKPEGEPKNAFVKWLKDFLSFKIMWIEPILKMIYYIATIFTILFSFTFLTYGGTGVLVWLVCLIFGPIVIRLTYEITMMFIMIWRNTRDIAENVEKRPATKIAEKVAAVKKATKTAKKK